MNQGFFYLLIAKPKNVFVSCLRRRIVSKLMQIMILKIRIEIYLAQLPLPFGNNTLTIIG